MNLLIISLCLDFPVVSPVPQHYSVRQLRLLNPACSNCGWTPFSSSSFLAVSPSISSCKVSSAQTQFALAKLYVVATKFNTAKADRRYINSGYAGSTCALYQVSYEYSDYIHQQIHHQYASQSASQMSTHTFAVTPTS